MLWIANAQHGLSSMNWWKPLNMHTVFLFSCEKNLLMGFSVKTLSQTHVILCQNPWKRTCWVFRVGSFIWPWYLYFISIYKWPFWRSSSEGLLYKLLSDPYELVFYLVRFVYVEANSRSNLVCLGGVVACMLAIENFCKVIMRVISLGLCCPNPLHPNQCPSHPSQLSAQHVIVNGQPFWKFGQWLCHHPCILAIPKLHNV